MNRVLLISANREHFPEPVFPLGAAYVAGSLMRQGKTVRIFDAGISRFPLHSLRREILSYRPDIIGLSLRNIDNAAYPCTRYYVPDYLRIIVAIRESSSARVVLGGSAFSIFPDEMVRVLGADCGIVGDGDGDIGRFFEKIVVDSSTRETEMPPLRLRGGRGSYAPAFFHANLNQVEFPREIDAIFPPFNKYRTIGVQTARGCPHQCIYCTYPILEGNKLRLRPPDVVAEEIEFLHKTHRKRDFFMVDSVFNANEHHMEKICRAIISRGLRIHFSCYLQPKMMDLSLFGLLAEAGCVAVDFGTDTASEPMLKSLRKGFSAQDILEVSDACHRAGIDFCHSLIFGGPGENLETVKETVRLMDEIKPRAVVAMTGIRIYPGTEIARVAMLDGVISPGVDLLRPKFYFHGEKDGVIAKIREYAKARRNWFLPGERDWSSALGPRLLRFFHRSGPLWRTFKNP